MELRYVGMKIIDKKQWTEFLRDAAGGVNVCSMTKQTFDAKPRKSGLRRDVAASTTTRKLGVGTSVRGIWDHMIKKNCLSSRTARVYGCARACLVSFYFS